ncbi:MAG: Eco57I restriction-modification methylase domain-containing protein, partial [Planctomycetota bacterium]|nr:Eco57I restriction-modification methylase domain-containing protein [Planctomycetota bacterium]
LLTTVERTVFGMDIDPEACQLARENVCATLERFTGSAPPTGYFTRNIAEQDFLLGQWPSAFPERMALVVGNPPYVAATRLALEDKRTLRAQFRTAFGRLDLYTLFLERSVSLLEPNGTLAFVTPDKFLMTRTSEPLRELLLEAGQVRRVARFRSHKVFEDAATVPCVTVFSRRETAAREPTAVLECEIFDSTVRVVSEAKLDLAAFGSAPWHLNQGAEADLASKIEAGHPRLGDFASRLSAGLATGLDGVFVMARERLSGVEPDLVRQVVRGRDLQAFRLSPPDLGVLLPYTFDADGRARLVDLDDYPGAREHLAPHERSLRRRHCVRVWQKAWYDLHDPVTLDLARAPKILVPDVAATNRFVFDPGRCWPLHSVYYVLPKGIDPEFLTAVLNSKAIEFLLRLRAPVVKDGFSRYRKQFLLPLPIPAASAKLRRRLIELSHDVDRGSFDAAMARLFGLSDSDVGLMASTLEALRRPGPHGTPR